jgi:hypothetical protein
MEGFRFVYKFILNRFGNIMERGYEFVPQGVTTSIGQSPSWEANSCCGGQEIPRFVYKSKVYYSGHKNPHYTMCKRIKMSNSYFTCCFI